MSTTATVVKAVKAGFIVLDAKTGAVGRIIAFQYNPETLVRRLDGIAASAGGATSSVSAGAAQSEPHEFVGFTLALDAADKLERGDPVTQQDGLHPMISTLELLLYPQVTSLVVWVSGNKRILPVRILQLDFNELAFDATLNPTRVDVSVQLQVLKDSDFPPNSKGRALWDAHFTQLQQLAKLIDAATLAQLGLGGVP
jgi:hypothetical protein